MGKIVTNGHATEVAPIMRMPSVPSIRGLKVCTRIEGKKVDMEMYNKAKVRATADDLALVREHFGLNISEALQVSLHLTAQAIRKNKANVEV